MSSLEQYMIKGYLPTIGIECHVQLKTKTKLFAGVANDARDAAPNTLVSHICLGMPGALPVLNTKAVELGARAAFALGTVPQKFSKFDRKHYFYPDLPKGYQITQFDEPIILGGAVEIEIDGHKKTIHITRAHLEEDAGKSTHPAGKDYSLVDLNRVGTPLLEIVSEPDIHSASEAKAYARELYLLMRYSEVSDADLYHGNMRFDVNVSVSKSPSNLGTRTETKNLNSFKSVEKAVEFEINRQIELLERGDTIVQETRGWDDAKQKTFSQRSKEEAHDYRYFPEPDIPPVVLDDEFIKTIKESMQPMPEFYRGEFGDLSLDSSVVDTLIEDIVAARLVQSIKTQAGNDHAKRVALWLANINEAQAEVLPEKSLVGQATVESAIQLSKLIEKNEISSTAGKEIWQILVREGGSPLTIAKERDMLQVSDEGVVDEIVKKVLADNPKATEDIKNGEMKAIGFLVGQVMKESKGKANPSLAQASIKKELGI